MPQAIRIVNIVFIFHWIALLSRMNSLVTATTHRDCFKVGRALGHDCDLQRCYKSGKIDCYLLIVKSSSKNAKYSKCHYYNRVLFSRLPSITILGPVLLTRSLRTVASFINVIKLISSHFDIFQTPIKPSLLPRYD